jgi:hypothetical protein
MGIYEAATEKAKMDTVGLFCLTTQWHPTITPRNILLILL